MVTIHAPYRTIVLGVAGTFLCADAKAAVIYR